MLDGESLKAHSNPHNRGVIWSLCHDGRDRNSNSIAGCIEFEIDVHLAPTVNQRTSYGASGMPAPMSNV